MSLLVFFLGFLELHLVYLDTVSGMFEVAVDGECVCVVDLFAFGVLSERSKLGASKRLERAFDFGFSWEKLALQSMGRCGKGTYEVLSLRGYASTSDDRSPSGH